VLYTGIGMFTLTVLNFYDVFGPVADNATYWRMGFDKDDMKKKNGQL
jgi:hypothetical protein